MKGKLSLNLYVVSLLYFILFVILGWYISIKPTAGETQYKRNNTSLSHKHELIGSYGEDQVKIVDLLKLEGLNSALNSFKTLYSEQVYLPGSCHGFLHLIGKEAYDQFGGDPSIFTAPEISFCNFGFYHGFVLTMFTRTDGNIKKVLKFCNQVEKRLGGNLTYLSAECIHAVGHGLSDFSARRNFGNPTRMINDAINECEQITIPETLEARKCVSGIYHGMVYLVRDRSFGLTFDESNPLELCGNPLIKFSNICYENMHSLAVNLFKSQSFSDAVDSLRAIYTDSDILAPLFWRLGHQRAGNYLIIGDIGELIVACDSLPSQFISRCHQGVITKFMHYGKPGEAYIRTFSYCNRLKDIDRKNCFSDSIIYFINSYPADIFKQLCETVPLEFKNICVK